MTPHKPVDCFFRLAGRRLVLRLAGARLLDVVDRERLREAWPAARRVDVLRAGMRQTVVPGPPPTGQADRRVPAVDRHLTRHD
jgi:hypothetical protein